MDVLKRINQLRLDRNWSVYRLCVESGLPQSTITNMFNRETLPSIVTLQAICHAFGITMSEFFQEDTITELPSDKDFKGLYDSLSPNVRKSIYLLMKSIASNP